MRRQICLLVIATLCGLLQIPGLAAATPQAVDDTARIERLAGLARVWGHVRYLHPSLATRTDVDWDAALVAAIPRVRSARTPGEYAAAVQSMLDALGDPLTRVVEAPPTTNDAQDGRPLAHRTTEDGVLIVTAGDYFALTSPDAQATLNAILAEVPKARALVLDLRSAEETGAYGEFQLAANFGRIERLTFTEPLVTPGDRRRVYYGFEGSSPFSSGQYMTGLFTKDGKRITPAQDARDIPTVTILNRHSGLLASTVALQAAGKGLLVFEGDARAASVGATETVDLADGLTAQVRVGEFVCQDGTSGDVSPDAVVPESNDGSDAAMERALALARSFKPSQAVRETRAATAAPPRDRSYADLEYPTLENRLLAAFRIWSTIHYFFPYKHLMDEDWDAVLRASIPKFERARDALEYSLAVAEMATHIHDSHTYVAGSVFNEFVGVAYPPIRVRMIEETPVVVSFTRDAGKEAGVEIGDVVVRVDGEDARERIARYARYIPASTPQSRTDKATLTFMNGPENSTVTLTLRGRDSREREVTLERKREDYTTLYHRERSGEVVRLLPGNVGYVDLDRLTLGEVDDMFERLKGTKAIVFDMRGYPNGTVWAIAPRLTDRRNVAAALFETPLVGHDSPFGSSHLFMQTIPPTPAGAWIYRGRTVMLVDERAQSQAEHTGLFLKAANGTTFVGSPTAGANGEITAFTVPGGITIGFTGQSVKFPDGRQLQRVGLVPDVEVRPTIEGVRAGRDEVLEAALEYLRREAPISR